MARIRLFHGAKGDGGTAERLRAAGHEVETGPVEPAALKALRAAPPDAAVIDLTGAFSFGRDIALWLRQAKATRAVPIVFVDGDPEKLERLRALLPDATFAVRGRIAATLKKALARVPADPVRPASIFAGYSGTPLPKKLGIKPGSTLALLNPPDGFAGNTLGPLPADVAIRTDLRKPADLILWFARSLSEVERRIEALANKVGRGGLWIAWPKRASGVQTDLTEPQVRRIGLANGLVDYKICAIDATWSGLRFARRSASK